MLKPLTTITEILMILYWIIAAAVALGWISIDPSLMYSDHENPLVIAWNWSFFPIDIAFSVLGLAATFIVMSAARKAKLETVAATLMLCAGVMALSFWTITGDYNPSWWGVNIWLVVIALTNLFTGKQQLR